MSGLTATLRTVGGRIDECSSPPGRVSTRDNPLKALRSVHTDVSNLRGGGGGGNTHKRLLSYFE